MTLWRVALAIASFLALLAHEGDVETQRHAAASAQPSAALAKLGLRLLHGRGGALRRPGGAPAEQGPLDASSVGGARPAPPDRTRTGSSPLARTGLARLRGGGAARARAGRGPARAGTKRRAAERAAPAKAARRRGAARGGPRAGGGGGFPEASEGSGAGLSSAGAAGDSLDQEMAAAAAQMEEAVGNEGGGAFVGAERPRRVRGEARAPSS